MKPYAPRSSSAATARSAAWRATAAPAGPGSRAGPGCQAEAMMLLIDPGIGTLRRAQVAGPSPGQVPQILWMIAKTDRNQRTRRSQRAGLRRYSTQSSQLSTFATTAGCSLNSLPSRGPLGCDEAPGRCHPGGSSLHRGRAGGLRQSVPARRAPAASRSAAAAAQDQLQAVCSQQAAWTQRGEAIGAGAVRGHRGAVGRCQRQQPGWGHGRELTSDAIAAATLPPPPVDPGSWKALTADYAAAGTAIANGAASGAVP